MIDSVLRWLELILTERFGHQWSLVRQSDFLSLILKGGDGAIIFDQLVEGFAEPSNKIPCSKWNAKPEGWEAVLNEQMQAPGISNIAIPLIEQAHNTHIVHYDILGLTYWRLNRM